MKLNESKSANLYHAIEVNYAVQALELNRLLGTSIHRFSPDGKIIPDPDFKYRNYLFVKMFRNEPEKLKAEHPRVYADYYNWTNSEWYVGLSLTRSKEFAKSWSSCVFVLDQEKLNQNYKIIPWNWGSSSNKYKVEQEEFLVLGRTDKPNDSFHSGKLISPDESNPKVKNLDRYLKEVYLAMSHDIFSEETLSPIVNHPKYKGNLLNL